jgi:RNA polymerase sigma factor (sigma-70 family)
MRIMTESDLIRKANEGDEASFSSIIEEHESDLRGVAFKILKNDEDVKDALQIVQVKVWKKIGTFDPSKGAKFSTWLHTITKNTCLDVLRKRNVKSTEPAEENQGELGDDPLEILIAKENEREQDEDERQERKRGRKVTPPELQHIHIEPANWRLRVERCLRESYRNRMDPRYLRKALRILSSRNLEVALLYLSAVSRITNNDVTTLILTCVSFPHPFTKKDAADVAAAIRLVRRKAGSLLVPDREAIDDRIKVFDELATRRVRPGPKGSQARIIIILLSRCFQTMFGRPVHGATAALLRATFPRSKWTAARVAETIARRKGPADPL